MAMVCFSVVFEHEPPCARTLSESPKTPLERTAEKRSLSTADLFILHETPRYSISFHK